MGGDPDLEESTAHRQDRSPLRGAARVPSVVPARSPDEVGTGLTSLWGGAPSRLVVGLPRDHTEEEDGPWPCPWAGTV